MPGPPMNINDQKFEPSYVFIVGEGGIGKSTLLNIIQSEYIYNLSIDMICYDFFYPQSKRKRFNLGITLARMKDKTELSKFICKKMLELPDYKLYIIEGFVLTFDVIFNDIVKTLNSKRIWKMYKV